MKISEAIANVLVERNQYKDSADAIAAIGDTFRAAFPYWSFYEWDHQLSEQTFRILSASLTKYPSADLKTFMAEIIPIIDDLKVRQA
jgi:hypothetical protein